MFSAARMFLFAREQKGERGRDILARATYVQSSSSVVPSSHPVFFLALFFFPRAENGSEKKGLQLVNLSFKNRQTVFTYIFSYNFPSLPLASV